MAWYSPFRKVPVVGSFLPEEKVDESTIDTGYDEYGAPEQALAGAWKGFDAPGQHAQGIYDQAYNRANSATYQPGQIRDVNLGPAQTLMGADQLRGRQDQDLVALQDAAAGRGPSAAQLQYAAAQAQARGQALALANTSRGAGRGAARLQALSNFGAQAGQNAAQSAALRAQEQQAAQAAYTQALQGVRGQDVNVASQNAQLAAEQARQEAALRLQRDTSQEGAARAAFDSTQNAQRGYLDTALGAVGHQVAAAQGVAGLARGYIDTAKGRAEAKQARYAAARAEEERRRRGDAADRDAITSTISPFIPKPKAPAGATA